MGMLFKIMVCVTFVVLLYANAIKITGFSPTTSLVITVVWISLSVPVAVLLGRRLRENLKYYREA